MKTLLRLLAAAAVTLLGTLLMAGTVYGAAPQELPGGGAPAAATAPVPQRNGLLVANESDLTLHYYSPKHSNSRELAQVLSEVAGRTYQVTAPDGTTSLPVSNVRTFGNVVVMYDRPERIAEMVKILAELEQADAQEDDATARMVVVEYAPQYLSTRSLYEALAPLRRQFLQPQVGPAHSGQAGTWVSNINPLESPAMLVLRDTPERVEEILALAKRLDVAPPQVQITCWLLRGADGEGTRLPADLVDNLSAVVPYEGFDRLCVSMIRTAVQPGQQQQLQSGFMDGEYEERFELWLQPAGFDRATGSLPISRCRFEASTGQKFETSLTLRAGEYTVLGAAGSDPLFVVLQVRPLDG